MEMNLKVKSVTKEGEATGQTYTFKNLRVEQSASGQVKTVSGSVYDGERQVGSFHYDSNSGENISASLPNTALAITEEVYSLIAFLGTPPETPTTSVA
jgi:hypothetical protein